MAAKKYQVQLSEGEREFLHKFTSTGSRKARQIKRAHILLLSDKSNTNASKTDKHIAQALGISTSTVARVRGRFVEEGLSSTLNEKPRPGQPPKLTAKQEAKLIALACSTPPEGHARWSLRLLADKVVELNIIDSISYKTVGEVLKKVNSSHT
jgi:transposase